MEYLDWNSLNRRFYLLDTFSGMDERFITQAEKEAGLSSWNEAHKRTGFHTSNVGQVRSNFYEWKNVQIIQGTIPETLDQIDSHEISFAHIDLNCSRPEVEAMEFLWERLVPGAMVLLDDYAYYGSRSQKLAMDVFARSKSVKILSVPTGQGLMIKTPTPLP